DGPGLGEDTLKGVARGVRGPDARGQGFGLGLAIAEAAARQFGGRLELKNGADGGTEASIVLPGLRG
ncbi:MAG: ATP-binding protein, partial [Myxococcota bacterium]